MSATYAPIGTANTPSPRRRSGVTWSLLIGAAAQVLLIGLPLLDLWVVGSVRRHVQAAYPRWGSADVGADTTAIIVAMAGIGVAGLLCWLVALFVTRRGRRARTVITSMFVVGVSVLGFVAGYADGPYQPIVPLWLGATTFLVATSTGLAALIAVWRRTR